MLDPSPHLPVKRRSCPHNRPARKFEAEHTAYPGAAYDTALAHVRAGRVLKMGGAAEAALVPLAEAQSRFQHLADAGNKEAERMLAVMFAEIGDCLADLGRLDNAAEAYEERIRRAASVDDRRGAAVGKMQLATVRLLQKRYEEALQGYEEARDTFQALGEPRSVATAWHQIGMAYQEAGQLEASERAYRKSLAINVRESNLPGQADSLGQLGNLYAERDLNEEAATLYGQAAEIFVRLGNLAREGRARRNIALVLLNLGPERYPEARQELQRAIECDKPYGHAAEPWKTWATLEDLEEATGHTHDAQAARNQAIQAYLAYRRDGGDSQSNQIQYFSFVAQAVLENTQDQAAQELNDLLEPDDPPWYTALIRQLQAVLAADRDPNLAADPELDYRNAAELRLLLDTLDHAEPDGRQD